MPAPKPAPSVCPVCHGELHVHRLQCGSCGTVLEGQFELNEFSRLSPDQMDYLRLFLKVRGNAKELERILGISYPTVRARYDELLRALGYEAELGPLVDQEGVLARLAAGELTVDQAERLLRGEE